VLVGVPGRGGDMGRESARGEKGTGGFALPAGDTGATGTAGLLRESGLIVGEAAGRGGDDTSEGSGGEFGLL
jgi:hypothetical protein